MTMLSETRTPIEIARNKSAKRARWANGLVGANVVLAVLAIGSALLQLNLLERIAAGKAVTDGEAELNNVLYGGIALLQVLTFLAAAVVWLMWLHSAYGNLLLVGRRTADETPGWAVGYWFIPFFNFFRPYRIVKELWLRSADMNMEPVVRERPAPSLISRWWGAWILSALVGWILLREFSGETAEELIQSTWVGMLDDLMTILTGVLAILIVRRIQQFQESWPPETADVFA
jgi:hypothetical protein